MMQGTHYLNFVCDLDHHADFLNSKSGQYEGNELPSPRRSVLSNISALVLRSFLSFLYQNLTHTAFYCMLIS